MRGTRTQVSPDNAHTNNIMQSKHIVFENTYVYAFSCNPEATINKNRARRGKWEGLKEGKEKHK